MQIEISCKITYSASLVKHDFILPNDRVDIAILGLGWISFKGNNQTFRVSVPKGVYIYTSRAKVKLNAKK